MEEQSLIGDLDLGFDYYENSIYEVVSYTVPEINIAKPLYVATTDMPSDYYAELAHYPFAQALGVPIRTFSHIGREPNYSPNPSFWIPIITNGNIVSICSIVKLENYGFSVTHTKTYSKELGSIAGKTSESYPLYLVLDGEMCYAVISDTAYNITPWAPPANAIPDLDLNGLSVIVKIAY